MPEVDERSTWLRCSIEPGMLPGEYAVEIETVEGRISLFTDQEKVRVEEGLLSVQRLDNDDLVRLPAYPFEVSSRNVRVRQSDLVNMDLLKQ